MKQKVIVETVDWFSVALIAVGAVSGVVAVALVAFASVTPFIMAPSFLAVYTGSRNLTKQTAYEIDSE